MKRAYHTEILRNRRPTIKVAKKHTLDSDEEDVEEVEGVLPSDDIEGEEDASVAREEADGSRMTAFNMKEEMEEGHFDQSGHFIWKNETEIRDNWLDNVDWQKVNPELASKYKLEMPNESTLADSSDSDSEPFNATTCYKEMLTYMQPNESVNKAIKRLGSKNAKLSSIERLRQKKAGILSSNVECTKLTELANGILTNTGNMDVYQETYEEISGKLKPQESKEASLDMYADDFDDKEQRQMGKPSESGSKTVEWELKWALDSDKIEGPYSTSQMIEWSSNGHFKSGVWVRKRAPDNTGAFYSSNRMDFEIYQ